MISLMFSSVILISLLPRQRGLVLIGSFFGTNPIPKHSEKVKWGQVFILAIYRNLC